MASRLSVCLLTRNDEDNIGRALRSVAGVADEVVVVDTGSTDRTAEVARGLGVAVVPFPWDDDFAEGRNFALGRASGDWVLWLNPDEELDISSKTLVQSLIHSQDDAFGHLAAVRSVPRADRPDQFSETWDLRLYRRRPGLRYVGRVHPRFDPGLAAAVAGDGQQVRPPGPVIRHHAYSSVLDESKLRWAVRLLERELRDRPGRLHYLAEYGRNLLLLKDPRGHEVMAEVVEQVVPVLDAPAPPGPDVQTLLEYALTTPAALNRSRINADRAATLALRWFPDSPPLLWATAESYFRAGQFRAAAILLDRLVGLGASGSYDHSRAFDPRIVGPWALLSLGQCQRALGRPDEARRCFGTLLQDPEFGERASALLAGLEGGAPGVV